MNPIGIFRHYHTEGPGYFASYLDRFGLPWQLICIDRNASIPEGVAAFSGFAFMGGPMSANDRLPWVDPVLHLIRDAVAADVPVIGHCLGGQLLAKALGGMVSANPVKEIGWGEVQIALTPEAARWFGPSLKCFLAFHWHGETFSLPAGAVRIMSSPLCANQGFVLGKHLGMQCHVEMTPELIETWCATGAGEIERSVGPGVQSRSEIERDVPRRVAGLHAVADRLYSRWVEGLVR